MSDDPKDPDVPTGLPDEGGVEPAPLGVPDPDPETPDTGTDAMPGITGGKEPPSSG